MRYFVSFIKQGVIQFLTLFGWCTLMCSALLGILIASGGLLLLADEGRQKTLLLPLVFLLGVIFISFRIHKKKCKHKKQVTRADKIISMMLYMSISLLISMVVMIYIFIPWWIPDYHGGFLLP